MAINRDVEVRARIEILLTEVTDPDNPVDRGGRRAGTEKRNITIPIVIMDYAELVARTTDIANSIQEGYELTGTTPPSSVTEGVSAVTSVSAVLHGRIIPNTDTSCGFRFGTTKELDETDNAVQSPIADSSDDPIAITMTLAELTPNTRYYYRAWSSIDTVLRVRYGRIRSFKTLAV